MTDTTQARDFRPSGDDHGVAGSAAVRSSAPFRSADVAALDALRVPCGVGGLVLLGPTTTPLAGIDELLASPDVEAVETEGGRLNSWITSPDEVLIATRAASSIIRSGRTAVVHLDSHCDGGAPAVSDEDCEFVCCRLGRIMLGLADEPAFIAVLGQEMALGLFDAVAEPEFSALGVIAGDSAVVELSPRSMFPEVPVSVTPVNRSAVAVGQAVEWFEAHRG